MEKSMLEEQHPPKLAILQDGTEIRLVPLELTKRPLYMDRDGHAFSYVRGMFRKIKPQEKRPSKRFQSKNEKRVYYVMRHHGDIKLHAAVLEAWGFPRPPGYQCDHINGDHFDNRLENLEWVTPQENARRRWLMHAARGEGYNGKKLSETVSRNRRKHNRYAQKHGLLVQLEINFEQ